METSSSCRHGPMPSKNTLEAKVEENLRPLFYDASDTRAVDIMA